MMSRKQAEAAVRRAEREFLIIAGQLERAEAGTGRSLRSANELRHMFAAQLNHLTAARAALGKLEDNGK